MSRSLASYASRTSGRLTPSPRRMRRPRCESRSLAPVAHLRVHSAVSERTSSERQRCLRVRDGGRVRQRGNERERGRQRTSESATETTWRESGRSRAIEQSERARAPEREGNECARSRQDPGIESRGPTGRWGPHADRHLRGEGRWGPMGSWGPTARWGPHAGRRLARASRRPSARGPLHSVSKE